MSAPVKEFDKVEKAADDVYWAMNVVDVGEKSDVGK